MEGWDNGSMRLAYVNLLHEKGGTGAIDHKYVPEAAAATRLALTAQYLETRFLDRQLDAHLASF